MNGGHADAHKQYCLTEVSSQNGDELATQAELDVLGPNARLIHTARKVFHVDNEENFAER